MVSGSSLSLILDHKITASIGARVAFHVASQTVRAKV